MVFKVNYILNSFTQSILKELEDVFSYILKIQFDLVFKTEETVISGYFTAIAPTVYAIGIALLIMMFLKKGFGIYVLWQDGDPDIDPAAYLLNFIKAIIVASCFPYVYSFFVDICEEFLDLSMSKISEHAAEYGNLLLMAVKSTSNGFAALVFIICYIILFFSFIMRGIELTILKVAVPLACVGLLDNDKGVFKSYSMQFVKLFLTTIVQLILAKIGCSLMFTPQSTLDFFLPLDMYFGIAC